MGSHDGAATELRDDAWDAVETVGDGLGCCVDRDCCILDTAVVRPLAIGFLG